MNKIDKISNFIEKNNIQRVIYSYNTRLINATNEYPEDYYAFEEKIAFSYVYDITRNNKKLIYQGNHEEALLLFLIKAFFLNYCRNNTLDKEKYEEEKIHISVGDKVLFYKGYKYYTFQDESNVFEEIKRLNKRICYLNMFLEEAMYEGLIKTEIELTKVLRLLSI